MTMLTHAQVERLIDAARMVSANAHAPYSRYHVGAAVLCADGSILTGANMENASYGLSLCAEAVVLATANSRGLLRQVRAMALFASHEGKGRGVTPCGRCRQMLAEAEMVAAARIALYCANGDEAGWRAFSVAELLPHGFALDETDRGRD